MGKLYINMHTVFLIFKLKEFEFPTGNSKALCNIKIASYFIRIEKEQTS